MRAIKLTPGEQFFRGRIAQPDGPGERTVVHKATRALAEKGELPPGRTPEHQKVRSAAVLLKRDLPFKDAAREALRAEPGKPHSSV